MDANAGMHEYWRREALLAWYQFGARQFIQCSQGKDREVFPGTGRVAVSRMEAKGFMEEVSKQWEILLVEDNPADIRLTREALKGLQVRHRLEVAEDGIAALEYLTRVVCSQTGTRPDIIFLDLNMPRMGGLEVLSAIKSNDAMKSIPVIILSSSGSDADVSAAYRLNANCYTQKPMEIDRFFHVMENIRRFWMETALLPGLPAGTTH